MGEIRICGPECEHFLKDRDDFYRCAKIEVYLDIHVRAGDPCKYEVQPKISLGGLESLGEGIFLGRIRGF
ncbi:MAG: hypothetical protein WC979_03480 [Candidatus Pacearchaeota archaeon]|jgi:hypothetical protein